VSSTERTTWERAGVSRDRWLQAMRTALKRHVEAANRRAAFYENAGDVIPMSDEEDRLRLDDEEAEQIWHDASAGDRAAIENLLLGN
jgi:2-phospho-L-lactate transferase/gluconeogenesis factor (CofD/UPF0052 family)